MSHLLTSTLAEKLYVAIEALPIVDYHSHLPAEEILHDHRFENIWELWLKHDHYKWRLMRACGVEESLITGDTSPREKFRAFASILPLAIGNPVYQWAHMELDRIFNIIIPLNAETADTIWEQANRELNDNLSVNTLLEELRVELIATTDDPFDDLSSHQAIAAQNHPTKVIPTFRPDKHLEGDDIDLTALKQCHDDFDQHGCLMSDHGMAQIPAPDTPQYQALKSIAQWNHEKGWGMQLHLGPQRNVNSRRSAQTGPDSGYDTIGSKLQTERLIHFLNDLDQTDQLPKIIVYNLNPNESTALCAALQNFQQAASRPLALPDGRPLTPGKLQSGRELAGQAKLQYGPAWWHLDHVRGIREQLDILTSLSAIGTHIGMLTDSRSFTSFVRHDYYRRILCSFLADKAHSGEMPNDRHLLADTAAN
ncbi:MAG: glucuronate isomerase, partial [Akkermansiaceae bacterium]